MATTQSLTNHLLQAKVGKNLQQFIVEQLDMGQDLNGVMFNLTLATGDHFDKRTVQKWIDEYK